MQYKNFLKSLLVVVISTLIVVTVVYAATTIGTNITSSGQLIIGNATHPEYFPNVQTLIIHDDFDITDGEVDETPNGLVAMVTADGVLGNNSAAVAGVARTAGASSIFGMQGVAMVSNSGDSGDAVGVWAGSFDTHAGGDNIGVYSLAAGGANNYSFYGEVGDFYNNGNISTAGTVTSSNTSSIGWSVQSTTNTACNSVCTSACVYGQDSGDTKNIVSCSNAIADTCVCAGGS